MKTVFIILAIVSIKLHAEEGKDIIDQFISSQNTVSESGFITDNTSGTLIHSYSLKNDTHIIHWLFQVANYWEHRISLIKKTDHKLITLDTISINGSVQTFTYKDDYLLLNILTYADKSPRCCPDISELLRYKILNYSFVLVNSPSKN